MPKGPGAVSDINQFMIGKLIADNHIATRAQVDECMRAQGEMESPMPLGTLLLERGYITEDQLDLILKLQRSFRRGVPEPADGVDRAAEDSLLGLVILLKQLSARGEVRRCMEVYSQIEEKCGSYLRLGKVLVQKAYLASAEMDDIQQYRSGKSLVCGVCGDQFAVSSTERKTVFRCASCGLLLAFPASGDGA